MTVAAIRSSGSARRNAGLRARTLRAPRPGTAQMVMAVVFAMIALAVTLQAQRVSGQDTIEGLMAETTDAARQGAELRARVAEAESPAEVLAAAEALGMVQPAAVVAVPATGAVEASPGAVDGPVG